MPEAEAAIAGFLARYTPEIAAEVQACRLRMQALVLQGVEMVYDNYNALVFGYGPDERASDAMLSIAAYPKWVTLFFLKGAKLADPDGLLQGSGKQVRSIRLASARDLDRPELQALMKSALATMAAEFAAAGARVTMIKSVSPKQRPRRPASGASP